MSANHRRREQFRRQETPEAVVTPVMETESVTAPERTMRSLDEYIFPEIELAAGEDVETIIGDVARLSELVGLKPEDIKGVSTLPGKLKSKEDIVGALLQLKAVLGT